MLVVREEGAKMPAHIGGTIYASLPKQQNNSLRQSRKLPSAKFVENHL